MLGDVVPPASTRPRIVVVETHPIQYHAPVWRALQRDHDISVTVVYGSNFSVAGYHDVEFGTSFSWDTDLLSGYDSVFLEQVQNTPTPSIGDRASDKAAGSVNPIRLSALLRELEPAAILLVGYSPRFYQRAIVAASVVGAPILFRAETTDHAQVRGRTSLVRDRLLRTFYRRCSFLLYIGRYSRDHYLRLGVSEDRLIFSPYCVDSSTFESTEEDRMRLRNPAREELGVGPGEHVVLFSGKLVGRKRPDLVIEALTLLRRDDPRRFVGVFIGDGALRSELEQRSATADLACRFVGFQNQRLLSRFFHAADVFVLPSQERETWGLVVNESLLHGLPAVVSQAVGCAPDLIEPGVTGETFETGRAESLAQSIKEVVTWSDTSADIRAACRERVSAYSVEAAARGIAVAFEQVTGGLADVR